MVSKFSEPPRPNGQMHQHLSSKEPLNKMVHLDGLQEPKRMWSCEPKFKNRHFLFKNAITSQ